MKILQLSLKVTTKYRVRNEYIRGTAQGEQFGDKVTETRLVGHVQRRIVEILDKGF